MKNNRLEMVLVLSASMVAVTGCDMSSNAILGGTPRYLATEQTGGCMRARQVMKVSRASAPAGTTCSSPVAALEAVEAQSSGALKIRVSKLPDGNYPVITSVTYDSPYGSSAIPFDCQAGGLTPDGTLKENTCTGKTLYRLSPVELASSDQELEVKTILLTNASCGAQATYEKGYDWDQSVDCDDQSKQGIKADQASFPSLFLERNST